MYYFMDFIYPSFFLYPQDKDTKKKNRKDSSVKKRTQTVLYHPMYLTYSTNL